MKGLESKTYGKRKPYGYRGFENPLVFFRTNLPEYADKGRRQLSLDHPGVYRALLRWGQLEEAIPENKMGKVQVDPFYLTKKLKSF